MVTARSLQALGEAGVEAQAGGDPRERDPELVRADVHNGLVSPERARDVYGVDTEELKWQTTGR